MISKRGITIFVPVYNEEALMIQNTLELLSFLDCLHISHEIIIGSNGSTDRTVQKASALSQAHSNVRFFHLPEKGVGRAFRRGVRMASHDRIITVDMDLSINLDFISKAHHLLDQADMVIGSKITGEQERSWSRKAASNLFIRLAGRLLHIRYHDYSIAAKAYRKDLVKRYLNHIDDHTFYVVEIVYRSLKDGKNLVEIPVQCKDLRGSRFNLLHEGLYKFGHLFWLWVKTLIKPRPYPHR